LKAYAAKIGVNPNTLAGWRHKLRRRDWGYRRALGSLSLREALVGRCQRRSGTDEFCRSLSPRRSGWSP